MMRRRPIVSGDTYRSQRARAGLTLVEVLVALLIIVIALVPLMTMLPAGHMVRENSEGRATTAMLADRKMTEVRAQLADDFAATPNPQGSFTPQGFAGYRYEVTVTPVAGRALKAVTVLCWHDLNTDGLPSAAEVQTQLDTYVAQRR
ncbi:MAG: prepilin-type N-terminal cleavage/methylation domain-containing protein [Armatimonadota bacterium]